jgi:hypothetical protein
MAKFNLLQKMPVIIPAFFIVLISFCAYSQMGIGLSDEGFLWYGMVRTSLGEVPIRDFQSYDAGRYYWGALCFFLFNSHGPIAFRASLGILEVITLTLALSTLKRVFHSWVLLLFGALLIYAWMYEHYKVFDIFVSVAAIYIAVLLLERPSIQRHFVTGLFVGFSAFIGINHGLYTSVSFVLLILFIWLKFERQEIFLRFLSFGAGVVFGCIPTLIMFATIPGFFESYLDWIKHIFIYGTNISLPVPWPWSIDYAVLNPFQVLRQFWIGIYFLVFPIFNLTIAAYLLVTDPDRLKRKYVLIASTFVAFTYVHYAFDRPDPFHLSIAISPLIIGLLSVFSNLSFKMGKYRSLYSAILFGLIFLSTTMSVGHQSPLNIAKIIIEASTGKRADFVQESVMGKPLWWAKENADIVKSVKRIGSQIRSDESILIAPHWPSLYAVMDRKSPTWNIYFMFSETLERQKQAIYQLENSKTSWAVIRPSDAIDGLNELQFKNAYPVVWEYLTSNFSELDSDGLPSGTYLMRKRTQ